MKDTSKQTTFVINTMSEETYKKSSSSGKINENELNIVDDNNTNRMVVASYDMLKNLENATAASIKYEDKFIKLKNAKSDTISQIDASDFIKDGMLNSISCDDDGNLQFTVKLEEDESRTISVAFVDQALSGTSKRAVSNNAVKLSVDAINAKIGDLQSSLLGFESKLNVLNDQFESYEALTAAMPAENQATNDTVKVVNKDVAIYYTVTEDDDGSKTWTEVKREQAAYVRSDEVDVATADLKSTFSSRRLLGVSSSYADLSSRLSSNVRVPSSKLLAEVLSSTEVQISAVDDAKASKVDFNVLSDKVDLISSDYLTDSDKTILSSGLSIDVVKNAEADDGYFATYEIHQGGMKVGTSINVPKDFLVKSGELKVCKEVNVPNGFKVGEKYIDFTINAKAGKDEESHIYIDVNDLVDVYNGASTDSIAVQIENNKVSASINSKGIVKDMLADEVSAFISSQYDDAVKYADEKIGNLSVDDFIGSVSKTVSRVTESSGIVSVEFGDISIAQSQVQNLSDTFNLYYKKTETSSASEISFKFDTLSTYTQVSAQLTNDGYALSADVSNEITSLSSKMVANDETLSNAISSKIKVGTYKDGKYNLASNDLSIAQIDGDDYYELVRSSSVDPKIVYVVSDDVLNAYDRKVTNVEDPEDDKDAVNKQYALSAIADALTAYYKKEEVQTISSDIVNADKVTISCEATAVEGYVSTYKLYQNGVQVGCDINIPKDFLVKSGKILTCTEASKPIADLQIGDKYLDFVVNAKDSSSTDEHIYIKVQDLVDIYVGTSTSSIETKVGDDNTISAMIVDKGITRAMLSDDVTSFVTNQCLSAKNYADDKITSLNIAALSCNADQTVDSITETSGIVGATFKKIQIAQSQVDNLETKFNDYYTSSQTSSAVQLAEKFNSLSITDLVGAKGKTATKIIEKDGIVSAQYEDIQISTSQVDGLSDAYYLKSQTSSATDIASEFSKLSTYAEVKHALSADGYALSSDLSAHLNSKSNPHEVKASQLSVYLSSETSSNVQLSTAFKRQSDALENIISSLWQNLSGYACEVTKDEEGKESINLKTATSMTSRDLAESILHVTTFLSSTWMMMQESHKKD